MSIEIESNVPSLGAVEHRVEVLALTPANQCRSEAFVVNPWHCRADTFQPVIWDTNSADTIPEYSHRIGGPSDVWAYSDISNLFSAFCPTQYYFLDQESAPGSGTWAAYTGTHITLDDATKTLSVTTSDDPSDYVLDGQILSIRIGVTSVPTFTDAFTPTFCYITVRFEHACNFVSFADNGGVTSPIIAVIRAVPHPDPILEPVTNFPYTFNGNPIECGPQTISIVD